MNGSDLIIQWGNKILAGSMLNRQEALQLAKVSLNNLPLLLAMADLIRQKYVGNQVDLCAIVNARSGKCPENCKFCAQAAVHKTNIDIYGLKSIDDLVAAAVAAKEAGARRFSIVTSGRGMQQDQDFENILLALQRIKVETGLSTCASLGILSEQNARALKDAGVTRYHHNVETSRSYYSQICTSHTYDDKMSTIAVAQQAGLEVCAGGIIGLGEKMEQRLEMAFELQELKIKSVPLNILNPIPGTGLANNLPLDPREILQTFALFRFILPDSSIRTAGGRELNLRDLQSMALAGGINGMLIGGYLTTGGRNAKMDIQMIADLGRSVAK